MRIVRHSILPIAIIALAVGLGNGVYAFHDGGVATCDGCHSVHNPYGTGTLGNGVNLLLGAEPSSACLRCHERAGDTGPRSYHISTPEAEVPTGVSPIQRSPGGDFAWLHKTYTWTGRSGLSTEEGQSHGHNIIATAGVGRDAPIATYNYTVDTDNEFAPGNSGFPSASLGCQSCHDPHGQARRDDSNVIIGAGTTGDPIIESGSYNDSADPVSGLAVGVYRILAGPGYNQDGVTFPGAPDAVAPHTYNQSEATNQVKVAYGRATGSGHATWSEWCGTCHPDMHYDNGANYVHKTDYALGSIVGPNYNKYKKTGDLTATSGNSFTSLVPYILNTGNYTTLKAAAGNTSATYAGPANTDRVDCLSCHRAHASGFEYALRWNPNYEFLTDENGNYFNSNSASGGKTSAEVEDAYYDRVDTATFAKAQRSLCNKCHIKD